MKCSSDSAAIYRHPLTIKAYIGDFVLIAAPWLSLLLSKHIGNGSGSRRKPTLLYLCQ